MKLMQHPKHGFHNVYTPAEEAEMRKNGWVEAAPVKADAEPIAADPIVEVLEPSAAKPKAAKPKA